MRIKSYYNNITVGDIMSEEGGEEPQAKIVRIYETVAFDPERGTYRAVDIRFEYPPGQFHDIYVPMDEYHGPEDAKRLVREWVERYGKAIGPV